MMNFSRGAGARKVLLVAFLTMGTAHIAGAGVLSDPADWKETDVPPPPAYDTSKLLTFDVTPSSALVYGVDPASFSISNADGIVRYVVVATSPSGAKNVIYEGLRCSTGEVRTYARGRPDGTWDAVAHSEWKSVFDPSLPKYSLRFAQAGACDLAAPVRSVGELVRKLKNPVPSF
jgi:hypothetical protein